MHKDMKLLIDKLAQDGILERHEFMALLSDRDEETAQYLFERARAARQAVYGQDIYMRGLIELTNYCKNDCYYCGIRKSNRSAERYRLTQEQVMDCCAKGYKLGFRTFVLQGGEDTYFIKERMVDIIRAIKADYADCAVTLSLGERCYEAYRTWREAGADRYLLRHETANPLHYISLHPPGQSQERRMECLAELKKLGYQVGCGFMVGSPYQTDEHLVDDLLFIKKFNPQMVGIGPFIPHHQTPFATEAAGSLERTLFLLGLVRLLLPHVLLPATTALGTIDEQGRESGILAGANVVMPNLSPASVRCKYQLYDNKICSGAEAAECQKELVERLENIGYNLVVSRGDYKA